MVRNTIDLRDNRSANQITLPSDPSQRTSSITHTTDFDSRIIPHCDLSSFSAVKRFSPPLAGRMQLCTFVQATHIERFDHNAPPWSFDRERLERQSECKT